MARPHAPVVGVGNLAMGGRGKTPVVALVARLLVGAGERPAIHSRGYRRRRPEEGVVIVSDGRHLCADLDRSGDEPLMLARTTPGAAVLVCDVRAMSAALAERALGATVHVLDDGFQHRSLRRDVDVVIVRREDLSDRRIPFGRLRSPVSSLANADAVIIDGAPDDDVRKAVTGVVAPTCEVFSLARRLGRPSLLEPERWLPVGSGSVVAMAGIAGPERFGDALGAAGWMLAGAIWFPDHHRYRRRDVDRVAAIVRDTGAEAVLTTEKDAMRLLPLRPLPVPIAAVPLGVEAEPAGRFRAWLLERIDEARR